MTERKKRKNSQQLQKLKNKPLHGNRRSHSMKATKRVWKRNTKLFVSPENLKKGKNIREKISVREYRTLLKKGRQ